MTNTERIAKLERSVETLQDRLIQLSSLIDTHTSTPDAHSSDRLDALAKALDVQRQQPLPRVGPRRRARR